jgi:hypothetical protein
MKVSWKKREYEKRKNQERKRKLGEDSVRNQKEYPCQETEREEGCLLSSPSTLRGDTPNIE